VKFFLWILSLGFFIHGSLAGDFTDYLDRLFSSHWPDSWRLGSLEKETPCLSSRKGRDFILFRRNRRDGKAR